MKEPRNKQSSKFLSLILRHKPQTIGLTLDGNGWADTQELLQKMEAHGHHLSFEQLQSIVANNDKQRFTLSPDGSRIRANQGHSIEVDLQLSEHVPPDILYHGTAEQNIISIKKKGLIKGQRHHVHLSPDTETARKVGMRYGKPVVLVIDAQQMHSDGYTFYQSVNGVWLTESVPPQYIRVSGE